MLLEPLPAPHKGQFAVCPPHIQSSRFHNNLRYASHLCVVDGSMAPFTFLQFMLVGSPTDPGFDFIDLRVDLREDGLSRPSFEMLVTAACHLAPLFFILALIFSRETLSSVKIFSFLTDFSA